MALTAKQEAALPKLFALWIVNPLQILSRSEFLIDKLSTAEKQALFNIIKNDLEDILRKIKNNAQNTFDLFSE
jgi:hypothetical protein